MSAASSYSPSLSTGSSGAEPATGHPFVRLEPWHRYALITYVLIYNVYVPAIQAFFHLEQVPYREFRLFITVLSAVIPLIPLVFHRPIYGWLHPLIFPIVIGAAATFIRNPATVFEPFAVLNLPERSEIYNVVLMGYSQTAVAEADMKMRLCSLLATVCYYGAFFFGPQFKRLNITFTSPTLLQYKLALVIIAAFGVFGWMVYNAGGLEAWMLRWTGGRNVLTERGEAWISPVVRLSLLACLIWYALDDNAIRNPFFLIASFLSVLLQFPLSGSRSAVVMAMVYFLALYMVKSKRIPWAAVILLVILTYLLIGMLGAIRGGTAYRGEVDWSPLTEFRLTEAIERSRENLEARDAGGSAALAVYARVPGEVDFLYGKTYASSLTFFIPRAIWPDKPRGAGIEFTRQIRGSSGGGSPIGSVAEAYWNFYYFGIVLLFASYGVFHRWLVANYLRFHRHLPFLFIYVITLVIFAPDSGRLTGYFQLIVPTIAIFLWLGVIKHNSTQCSRQVAYASPTK